MIREGWKRFRSSSLKVKLLISVVLLVILGYGILQLAAFYTMYQVNHMMAPVNEDADFPRKAFVNWQEQSKPNTTWILGNLSKIQSGEIKSRYFKRHLVGGIGLLDQAIFTSTIFAYSQYQTHIYNFSHYPEVRYAYEKPGYRVGFSSSTCAKTGAYQECGHDTRFGGHYTRDLVKSFHFLSQIESEPGALYELWKRGLSEREIRIIMKTEIGEEDVEHQELNKSIAKMGSMMFLRSEYYDNYLNPGGFQLRPVEIAFYTSTSGLHVIGSDGPPLYVDGEKVEARQKYRWTHANVTLEPGYHNITMDGYTLRMPVYDSLPTWDLYNKSGDTYIFISNRRDDDHTFHRAIIKGENWEKKLQIGDKEANKTVPSQPQKMVLVADDFRVPIRLKKEECGLLCETLGIPASKKDEFYDTLNRFRFIPLQKKRNPGPLLG